MKTFFPMAVLVCVLIACKPSNQSIEGKWNSLKEEGLTLYFRKDGTCDGFVNGKSFTSGYYNASGDTIVVQESNPDSYPAIYTLQFEGDKVTWHVVSDTLSGRHEAMKGHVFKRIKG